MRVNVTSDRIYTSWPWKAEKPWEVKRKRWPKDLEDWLPEMDKEFEEFDKEFDDVMNTFSRERRKVTFIRFVDESHFEMDAPGFSKKDVTVSFNEKTRVLTIKCKKEEKEAISSCLVPNNITLTESKVEHGVVTVYAEAQSPKCVKDRKIPIK